MSVVEDDCRPNPDVLLQDLLRDESAAKRGKLFIFLGMCPGVGKTYAMLEAARARQAEGVDVLVGVVETHGRAETAAMVEGMKLLPKRRMEYRGHEWEELDLDAVLALMPDLVLVDELAHRNVPGSRHAKRYQDVLELLAAGIDVYTTLNVQHIESQVDVVQQITGVTVTEKVPDSILDHADEIEVIDLSVDKLLDRLATGKVYLGERADEAAAHFFTADHLTALREMALRFTAEHVDRGLEDMRRLRRARMPWKTHARLLVGVGPSPYAESLIRWTRRAATRVGCPWMVVWVEGVRPLSADDQRRLSDALALGRRLGAEVVSVTGEEVSEALLQVARERNVTQMVVGKPGRRNWLRRSLADRVIRDSGDIDVCVVRPVVGRESLRDRVSPRPAEGVSAVGDYVWSIGLTLGLVMVGWWILPYVGYAFIGLLFLLAIVIGALRFQRGPVFLMAALCALLWNYFFIDPAFSLSIGKAHDLILFVMFFIVALSMGHLTHRLRLREVAERERQRHTAALLRVTQSAALSAEPEKGLREASLTMGEVLDAEVALIVRQEDRLLPKVTHPASQFTPSEKDWGVIHWSYQNKQPAGRFTDTLPQSEATWFPLQTATAVMGVVGVRFKGAEGLRFGVRQSIEAFALQLALVLEKEHFVRAIYQAEIFARSEQLQRTLLDSVSHELKTPLAVIEASLEGLSGVESPYLDELRMASRRLQRVVNHLLQMTRIEAEAVRPAREWCVVGDLVSQAMGLAGEGLEKRPWKVDLPSDLPVVRTDPNLLCQVLVNVLHNAQVYTPEGSPIEVTVEWRRPDGLVFRVGDRGAGLGEGDEVRVFQKFYRSPGSPTGGTGLGLSIARALIRSLGGDIVARNREGGGAEFVITLAVEVLG